MLVMIVFISNEIYYLTHKVFDENNDTPSFLSNLLLPKFAIESAHLTS